MIRRHPNDNLTSLKSATWSDVLGLLGADAEVIFSSLLLDCGIFTLLDGGKDNYFQLSGVPLSELPRIPSAKSKPSQTKGRVTLSGIQFVRHRMLYAKPSLNTAGKVKFGLHHTHILQRVSNATEERQAVHLLKYMFPRQFSLHNVFTSTIDPEDTVHKLKDYTFREEEIASQNKRCSTWAPRRMRGESSRLVKKIFRQHQSCSYSQLLRHYCPVYSTNSEASSVWSEAVSSSPPGTACLVTQVLPSDSLSTKPVSPLPKQYDSDTSFLAHATPVSRVAAFCRAVLCSLLPGDVFGKGQPGHANLEMVLRKVDDFVCMRRFESISLHQVVQGLRISVIEWLSLPGKINKKISKSDYSKRLEILHEFVYYVFDSLLIPLVRAHFYVTETSTRRNRLYYFRQDVWRKLSEPSLASLRLTMYSSIRPGEARAKLQSRSLGYSSLRLLPKARGTRPITNLKRRPLKLASGKRVLGQSINNQLVPLFSVLNYQRMSDASPLGSAMLSVGELHRRVADFKNIISPGSRLFFAKVDVKSCFDSIPQDHLLGIIENLISESSYRTSKHVELKTLDNGQRGNETIKRKYTGIARPADESAVVSAASASRIVAQKHHVVMADLGYDRVWTRDSLLEMLHDHIADSIVKVGKKYMKQVDGIPQGSCLSSLLCSYFYGAFERNELAFLDPQSCLLLRMIDDFLLVTTDSTLARRFLEVMATGDRRYGIQVNADKSLVNFDVAIHGHKLPRIRDGSAFPFLGKSINMQTLELGRGWETNDEYISNTLTVEKGSRPGDALKSKISKWLKIRMYSMVLDMSLNSRLQVVSTLAGNFCETAMKMHRHILALTAKRRPSQQLIIEMIKDLILAAWKICRANNRRDDLPVVQQITQSQMSWIAAVSFERVLQPKQTQYKEVLVWLRIQRERSQPKMNTDQEALEQLLEENDKVLGQYVY